MSETLNPVMQELARQVGAFVIREIRSGPQFDTPWMTDEQAGEYLGLKKRGMQNHRRLGTGPKWCKAGVVRYHRDDLDAFLRAGEVVPA